MKYTIVTTCSDTAIVTDELDLDYLGRLIADDNADLIEVTPLDNPNAAVFVNTIHIMYVVREAD